MNKLKTYLIVLLIALLPLATAQASPSGTWSPAGSMTTPRGYSHTATLLLDGRVLVTGGGAGDSTLDSTELYDPITNTWNASASMSIPRTRHTATQLLDGRILVAGGRSQTGQSLAITELYDPQTGTWSLTGSMATPRDWHTATLLPDGRVLVTGGVSANPKGPYILKSAEIYDPQTGAWSSTDKTANARFGHKATLLTDGRVMVTGGANSGGHCTFVPTAEVYDPRTGKWANTRAMDMARGFHFEALLPDGRVLVGGGWGLPVCFTDTAASEIYDPIVNRWNPTGNMTTPRGNTVTAYAQLLDGRVLVAGGATALWPPLATAELFDPATGLWTPTGSMADGRIFNTTTLLMDGRVLVAGGVDVYDSDLATAEIYTP